MTIALSAHDVALAESRLLSVEALDRVLSGNDEHALLDAREEGVRARDGHIILSVPLPLSRIELRVATLVPRLDTRIVLYDDGAGRTAERAAKRLRQLGYSDISILDGGVAAWKAAGHEVYTGTNVLSKAFGEFVEHAYGTPHVSAKELKQRLDSGEDVVVLDGRTLQEFENFSIPGAHAVPNAELPYRVHGLVKSPETLVVVNCAGRTRSIIGAQALINAGLPNKVVALENGTMAWLFEGYALDHGKQGGAPPPNAEDLTKARQSVERLTARFGIRYLDQAGLAKFQAERNTRSLYLYDVRTQAEFEAGHLPGSLWAEGGQFVQGVDRWVGTRNARVVLVDDEDGVRAAITASWLIQIGWGEVFVYTAGLSGAQLETGPAHPPLPGSVPNPPAISAGALKASLDRDAVVLLDLDNSLAYRAGHIPGARFAIRAYFAQALDQLPAKPIVLTSSDGVLAAFAAPDLAALTQQPVTVLEGGTDAWRAAELPIETGDTQLLHASEDVARSPYQVDGDRFAAFRAYLDWEIGLVDQLQRDRSVQFKTYAAG